MMKPAFEHTAAAEQNAIATARRHLQADRNQQLIAKVFSKADEAEEGLTPRAYRERNAAVRLEARVKLAEEGERTALELRPVDDAAVVWVRALPADAAAAGLRELLAGFGTVVGCALHPLAKWEEAEFEARRTDEAAALTTWGLVAFSEPAAAAAALDCAAPLVLGGNELGLYASDLASHLQYDYDGGLWDLWLSLQTVRVQGIPQETASRKELCTFLEREFYAAEIPWEAPQRVTIVHHYNAETGSMIGDALVTTTDVASAFAMQAQPLAVGEARLSVAMTDVAFEVREVTIAIQFIDSI